MANSNNLDVTYPVRLKREVFERVKEAAAREGLQAVQFIRRAVLRELEATEDSFSKTLREIGERAIGSGRRR